MRRTSRMIEGIERNGWFVEDFTLAEIKGLTARERLAAIRPDSAAYDGACGIPSLNEVLAMVRSESVRGNRSIGVLLELKHAAYFDSIRSEEHTSELQSPMSNSYDVFCLKQK